ncbi:MAG: hypothetical protein LQ340_003440 [Diploschistes diacapsis]|nr:MAG: hypothetical protein LQ340_003440 [Diploschistes diacapsis]
MAISLSTPSRAPTIAGLPKSFSSKLLSGGRPQASRRPTKDAVKARAKMPPPIADPKLAPKPRKVVMSEAPVQRPFAKTAIMKPATGDVGVTIREITKTVTANNVTTTIQELGSLA